MGPFSLLLANPKNFIYLAVALVVSSLALSTWYYKHSYESQIAKTATIQQEYEQAASGLQACNQGVDAIKTKSDIVQKQAAAAVAKANKDAKKYRDKADAVLASVPKTGDKCKDSESLLDDYLNQQGASK
jgi:F0F1-type ATP synthase membrane subunit b/b'